LEVSKGSSIDNILLEHFEQEIWSKVPHLEETKIVNATPLTDLTEDLKECAKSVYKADFTNTDHPNMQHSNPHQTNSHH